MTNFDPPPPTTPGDWRRFSTEPDYAGPSVALIYHIYCQIRYILPLPNPRGQGNEIELQGIRAKL
ncbi:hypothetical protein NG797_08750 [Laspinema sp. D5]|nr:hypothetical protein [Laspinema sp. D3d]